MINGALGLSPEDTRTVLMAATRAPSVHNSQPWRFRTDADSIELLADPARRLPVADPEDRELRLACGAALLNLRLALLNLGIEPEVRVHPGGHGDSIATVRHGGHASILAEEAARYRAIRHRRTNRKPFLEQPVGTRERHLLVEAAEEEDCRLRIVSDAQQQADLHRLLVRAHRHQLADPRWVDEFNSWLMRSPSDPDGVTLAVSGPQPELQDIWVLRDFGKGHGNVRVPGKDFESEPLIAALTSYVDDPFAQVRAGQALQNVLLTATTLGLSASFLSQVIEVTDVRARVRELLGGADHPQAAVRIGYGSPVPALPRRSVEDCLIDEAATG
jgi:nitroreductase